MIPTKPSDVLSVWSTLSARGIVQEEPKDDQTNATLERSGDQTGDEEDDGTPRVIVTTANGRPMSGDMDKAFKTALEEEMRALMLRERSVPGLVRMRVETWTPRRGGWVLTPGGTNPTPQGASFRGNRRMTRPARRCVIA